MLKNKISGNQPERSQYQFSNNRYLNNDFVSSERHSSTYSNKIEFDREEKCNKLAVELLFFC